MILINNLREEQENLFFNYFGSKEEFKLINVSKQRDAIYKFKKPQSASKNDRFIIEYFGNKPTVIDGMNYEIAHYILIKKDENSAYLIKRDQFDFLFEKCN